MSKLTSTNSPDCTIKCQSSQHGDALAAAITKRSVSDSDLCAYLAYTCACCETVRDSEGRLALHVAASCGRTDLVRWLVANRHAPINSRDKESGYTALHRSIYYGKLETAVELIKLGAVPSLQDANSLTYLEHAMVDRYRPIKGALRGEAFTWGTNSNNSLGSQTARTVPESMDDFHRTYSGKNVAKILINQFHSVILTDDGCVYSCGHGQGGRLGLGIQHTELTPKLIKFGTANSPQIAGEQVQILSCSIARDHSLFLAAGGELYACGLNKHRVLGVTPPPNELLVPKVLKHTASDSSIVATGNYHSLVWNMGGLYTWGLNAGQLGHQLHNADNKYIITPKLVKCINHQNNAIKLVCASTGATVVYTEKGDVYVLHEYQCRKVASRQLNLTQMAVIGGKLNHSLDEELSDKNRELIVTALTNTGNLLLWRESDPVLRRCVFSVNRALVLEQMTLNINHVLCVTRDGEAFKGDVRPRKRKLTETESRKTGDAKTSDFHKFLERDECVTVKLERVPRIHRAVSIESDPKGQNFGIVQDRPYKDFPPFEVSESTMINDMVDLFETAAIDDDVSDVELKLDGRTFVAHKFVLASKSRRFADLFRTNPRERIIELKGHNPIVFDELLRFIYTGTSELLRLGELKNRLLLELCNNSAPDKENLIIEDDAENRSAFEYYSKKNTKTEAKNERKLDNPVRMLHELAKRFEVETLQKALANLDLVKGEVRVKKDGRLVASIPVKFRKDFAPQLCDVQIQCDDKKTLKAHKCILAARLDYFHSMFSSRWKGGQTTTLQMPYSSTVVETLLEYLYSDSLDNLDSRDIDQLFNTVVLADQFFVDRLKDQCGKLLSDLLTIKNATQLLSLAHIYNVDRLKENCFRFIQQNVTSFLEMRLLDGLDAPILAELSDFFQTSDRFGCRVITPYSTAVSDEEIVRIGSSHPVDMTAITHRNSSSSSSSRQAKVSSSRRRLRNHKNSISEKVLTSTPENEVPLHNISISCDAEEEVVSEEPSVTGRIRAILNAREALQSEDVRESFSPLSRRKSDHNGSALFNSPFGDCEMFPLLNSPPGGAQVPMLRRQRTTIEPKLGGRVVKLSQKQRKRLSSESGTALEATPPLAESPKNPWKILPDPVSPLNSPPDASSIGTIMFIEKKSKENLVKITNKPLMYTQMEDRAIDELGKFYGIEELEDEIILVDRVSMGAVAQPVWVLRSK